MIIKGVREDQLLQFATSTLNRMDQERNSKVDDWVECGLAWLGKFGRGWKGVKSFRSQRYFPYANALTNAVVSSYVNAVMPHDDFFQIFGRTPERDQAGRIMAATIKWGHSKTGLREDLTDAMLYAGIYGSVPVKVDWFQQVAHTPDYGAMSEARGDLYESIVDAHMKGGLQPPSLEEVPILVETIQKTQVVWSAAKVTVGSIFDYWQDRWRRGESYPMRIIRDVKQAYYLREMAKPDQNGYAIYENVEDLTDGDVDTGANDQSQRTLHSRNNWNDMPSEGVELHEYWGDFEIEGEDGKTCYRNHVLVVANQAKVIRFEPNPYDSGLPPWDLWPWRKIPGEVYGMGIIEPILPLNDALQVRWNQEIEARGLQAMPIFEVKIGSVLDIDNIKVFPGAVYPTLDGNSVRKIEMGSSADSSMQEISFILNQMNEITGAQRAFSSRGNEKSATETSAIKEKMQAIEAERAMYIEKSLILGTIYKEIKLFQQFMDEKIQMRILNPGQMEFTDPETGLPVDGPPFLEVTKNDIAGDFDLVVQGSAWSSARNNMAQALQQFTLPLLQNQQMSAWFKEREFITTGYQGLGVRDAWKFVKTQEEYNAYIANQSAPVPGQPGGPQQGGNPGAPGAEGGPPNGGAPSVAGVPEGPDGPPATVDPGQLAGPQLSA